MRRTRTSTALVSGAIPLAWRADSLYLALHLLPRALGIPRHRRPSAATIGLIRTARARLLDLAQPAAMLTRVDRRAVTAIVGASTARPPIPLDDIAPHADTSAVFVATLGPLVDDAIHATFDEDPALAFVLDAVAALATADLRVKAAANVLAGVARCAPPRLAVTYSPGHCGLALDAQDLLFSALPAAGAVGITLTSGGLMQPTKSVSGMVLVAPRATHDVGFDYTCCATCASRHCRAAMAAAPSTESPWVPRRAV